METPYIPLPREIYNHFGVGLGEQTDVGLIAPVAGHPDLVIRYFEEKGEGRFIPNSYTVGIYDLNFIVRLKQLGSKLPSRWSFWEEEKESGVREWKGSYGRQTPDIRTSFAMDNGFALFIAEVNVYAHQKVAERLRADAVQHG